jgi:poly-gamma-glutamate synthesis protein (capsule biosynthesis protein)
VAALRPEVDLVVVILHSGYEYIEEPSEPQVAAARAAVDAGADLVVGHHAHILQGIHSYRDGVIAYGLGNFVFNITGPPETAILNVWLDQNGVRQLELIPAIVQQYGQPRPADFAEAGADPVAGLLPDDDPERDAGTVLGKSALPQNLP